MKKLFSKKLLAILLAFGFLFGTAANAATFIVPQGGTGATTFSSNAILKGAGTSPISASGVSIDSSNNISGAANLVQDSGTYTVGPTNSGAKYLTDGTADDVQINQAISDCNAATTPKCNNVLLEPGTFTQAEIIRPLSNVRLLGFGRDVTIIKAVNSYNPSGACQGTTGRRCMLANTAHIDNFTIADITFDQNVQNIAGLTSDNKHKAIWIQDASNLSIERIKVYNGINYSIAVYYADQVWIENNIVWGGYSSTYDQNDGIHVRAITNYHINFNNINTAKGGGTSGDDAIAILPDTLSSADTSGGEVIGNVIEGSGSRGIIADINSQYNVRNLIIAHNIISNTVNAGIKFYTAVSQTGNYYDIKFDSNLIYNVGTTGADGGHGIFFDSSNSANRVLFENITAIGNTIKTIPYTSGYAIYAIAKGNDFNFSYNTIDNVSGLGGIVFGSVSNPITDFVMNGNKINVSNAASNVKAIYLRGTSQGTIIGNEILGHTTGTTYGIYIEADGSNGATYNNISTNFISTFDNGITEINSGANPDFNQIFGNDFSSVTTKITTLGTNTNANIFNHVVDVSSNGNWGLGTGNPSAFLHISPTNRSGTPGTSTNALRIGGNTFTDINTAGSGTAALFTSASIGQATLAATNSTVTTTDAATLYITGGPVKGTNDTVTNAHALYINAGSVGAQTNSYGLTVNAQTGASSNYAAQFLGGQVRFGGNAIPLTSDGAALGTSALMWSDEFLASGGVINFNNGDVTLTHSSDKLQIDGGAFENAGSTIRSSRSGTATQYMQIDGGGSGGPFITASSTTGSPKNFTFNVDVSDGSIQTNNFYSFQLDGNEAFRIGYTGHIATIGTAPALSSCGTSPSILATSTDNAGIVTVGSVSATSCTVTFATAYTTAPACIVTDDTSIVALKAATTTTTLIFSGTVITSDVVSYICMETI